LVTQEGAIRRYTTTNRLLKTYVPVIAAKTGYTREAKENLALLTEGSNGQRVGAVVLGSDARFQDSKVLVEWIWRNYSWPS
jgi:D-alanyl-D-alanine carboxypeptidase